MPTPNLPDQTVARFAAGKLATIDSIVGKGKRAAFIRDAVDEKIEAYARELGNEAAGKVQRRKG